MIYPISRRHAGFASLFGISFALLAGCKSANSPQSEVVPVPAAQSVAVAPPVSSLIPSAIPQSPPVRIKAGNIKSFKDQQGYLWLADQGFDGGDTIDRPDIQIANTKEPAIYQTERYGMNFFSWPVPNGKYLVKLHFAETFEGITGPGERVFSFNVQGREFKDFDVWTKAGGPARAYVESVPTEITNGAIRITFSAKVENPQINGIEILPQP